MYCNRPQYIQTVAQAKRMYCEKNSRADFSCIYFYLYKREYIAKKKKVKNKTKNTIKKPHIQDKEQSIYFLAISKKIHLNLWSQKILKHYPASNMQPQFTIMEAENIHSCILYIFEIQH